MKIISKSTGETIAKIITNHSMTLDEAIELIGEIHPDQMDESVLIGGEWYYYEDLDLDWGEED
jgi:hypothetical protein